MVRSVEDCKSGVDALKEVFTELTKTNQSKSVLDEWYTEPFQDEEFLDYVPDKDLLLWIKNHKKTVSNSLKEALVEGMYLATLTFTVKFCAIAPNTTMSNNKYGTF